jgi:multiple antibiotic resistance protein
MAEVYDTEVYLNHITSFARLRPGYVEREIIGKFSCQHPGQFSEKWENSMGEALNLFIGTFTTLLAVINPLEAMPIFLQLLHGRDDPAHRRVALRSCLYATILMFFFLIFGTLIMRIFGVPLSMVRIVGGIILMRLGFELFAPSPASSIIPHNKGEADQGDVAFIPLAMPIMVGPGVIATILGMASTVKQSEYLPLSGIPLAIVVTMLITYLSLARARKLMRWFGQKGIDAASRIVGFFVAAMGMGLIFHGVIEALHSYGIIAAR